MKYSFVLLSAVLIAFSGCCSCQRAREIDERRTALLHNDEQQLEAARIALHEADSIAAFMDFEVEDIKEDFVFQKNDKYQSKGFYLLKEHENKISQLSFFAEVEEEGQMLLVSIDDKRKWNFLKTDNISDKSFDSKVMDFLGRELTDDEKVEVKSVFRLSSALRKLNAARSSMEKNRMKIEFYEKKIKSRNSFD